MNLADKIASDWLMSRVSQPLSDLVQLCDQHAGFVSAILTGVYVLATFGLVLLGYRQLRLAFQLERSRTQPSVVIDLITAHAHVHVTLKNLGQTAAYDIQVIGNPEIRALHGGQNTFPSQERDEPIPFLRDG